MAYHGYIKLMQQFLGFVEIPHVLEIGVDTGATIIPIIQSLTVSKKEFYVDAVDVKPNFVVDNILKHFSLLPTQRVSYVIGNSLDFLEKSCIEAEESEKRYDLALVDGDHNFFTVSRELEFLSNLMAPASVIFCDDYIGRWSTNDLFYATREGYENNILATQPVDTEKKGVKAAVDEFVAKYPEWEITVEMGEPAILSRNIKWKRTKTDGTV